jgi:hypothetical protein
MVTRKLAVAKQEHAPRFTFKSARRLNFTKAAVLRIANAARFAASACLQYNFRIIDRLSTVSPLQRRHRKTAGSAAGRKVVFWSRQRRASFQWNQNRGSLYIVEAFSSRETVSASLERAIKCEKALPE